MRRVNCSRDSLPISYPLTPKSNLSQSVGLYPKHLDSKYKYKYKCRFRNVVYLEFICVPSYLYLAKIDLHICIRRAAIHKRHGELER